MERLSADIKYMPQGFDNFKFLLVVTCELTNFTLAIPLKQRTAQVVAEALLHRLICIFGLPRLLIVDQDKGFTAQVIQYMLAAIDCKLKIISPYNHGSSKTERQIRTISSIINKHLTDKGDMWPLYASVAAYAMNTFASEALAGISPYELVFLRKPPDLLNLTMPDFTQYSPSIRTYLATLIEKAKFMKGILLDCRTTQALEFKTEKDRYTAELVFTPGTLVYVFAPHASSLQSGTTKFRQDFIGPLVIDTVLDSTHYKLRDLANRILPDIYHINRLKAARVLTPKGTVITQQDLIDKTGDTVVKLPAPSK